MTREESLANLTGGKVEWYGTHKALTAAERRAKVQWDGNTKSYKPADEAPLRKAKTGSWGREYTPGKVSALTAKECAELGLTPGPANKDCDGAGKGARKMSHHKKNSGMIGNMTVSSDFDAIVYGSVRGLVSEHRLASSAVRSLASDQRGCRAHGGYSDAAVYCIADDAAWSAAQAWEGKDLREYRKAREGSPAQADPDGAGICACSQAAD